MKIFTKSILIKASRNYCSALEFIRTSLLLTFLIVGILTTGASAQRNTDLPHPDSNMVTAPAGALIIPMDNTLQLNGSIFNLKAYGLITTILNNKIALHWIIKAGKVKNGIDFTATASKAFPAPGSATQLNFSGGPFLIFPQDTTGVAAIINTYNAANSLSKVNVYRLASATRVDERYLLTQIPKVAIMTDGKNEKIHQAYMAVAGIPDANWDTTAAVGLTANCYTFASEPHSDKVGPTIDSIHAYVNAGGNFLAECLAVNTYENALNGRFQAIKGIKINNTDYSPLAYPNADLSFSQFIGGFNAPNVGGAERVWYIDSVGKGGGPKNNMYKVVTGATPGTDTLLTSASVSKCGAGPGHLVFYCGGHDYTKSLDSTSINGLRLYFNAMLTPSGVTQCNFLHFDNDLQVTKTARQPSISIAAKDTFIIVVKNNGPSPTPSGNKTAVEPLPPGVTYSSAITTKGTYNSNTGLWTIGSMALNESDTLTVIATATASGTITNTVYINKDKYDANQVNDTANATVVVLSCTGSNLSVTASGATTFCQGGTVTLTANGALNYLWNTGATTTAITVNATGSYSVTGTDANGCRSASTGTVVTVNPKPQISINPLSLCEGTSGDICATGTESRLDYRWNTGIADPCLTAYGPGTYAVTVTDENGCKGTASVVVNMVQPPNLKVITNGPTTFCEGDSVILTAGGADSYMWNTGSTAASITVKTSGLYSVTGSNSGCEITSLVRTTVRPSAVINVTPANVSLCQGDSVTLTASSTTNFYWSTGVTTTSITVKTQGTYSVFPLNNNGCIIAGQSIVNVYPHPKVSINPLTLCEGTSGTICATGTGTSLSYRWNNNINDACLTVSIPQTYSVTVTDGNNCTATASSIVDLANPPSLRVARSGPTTFCEGDSVTLTASGAINYSWNTGATTASIKIKSGGLYTVTGNNSPGCDISVLVLVKVLASPQVTVTPSGNTSFCQGGSVTLNAGGAASYSWSNNKTGLSINVNASGKYTVTGTDINGCKGSASKEVTVNALPAVTLANFNTICINASPFVLNQGSPAGGVYSGPGVSNGTFNPIAAGGPGIYPINYSYTDNNGCINSTANSLKVEGAISSPGHINGPMSGMCGNATYTYSIPTLPGATSYTWTVPAGSNILSGQGTASITVSFSNSFNSGRISVSGNNTCSRSTAASALISSAIAAPNVIYGNTNPCKKGYNLYWIKPVTGASSYIWTVPDGSTILSGQGNDTIAVNIGNKGGNITVKAYNECKNKEATATLPINVNCRLMDPGTDENTDIANNIIMTVYPNPAHNELNVVINQGDAGGGDYLLRILDMTGRIVMEESKKAELDDTIVNLHISLNFAKGLYIVSLTSGDFNKQTKIIVE